MYSYFQHQGIPEKNGLIEEMIYNSHNCDVYKVSIKAATGEEHLGKSMGEYYTVTTGKLSKLISGRDAGECLAEILGAVLSPFYHKRLCICGLGNSSIVPDSLGPETIKMIPAMFLERLEPKQECKFSKMVTVIPNVKEQTNFEAEKLVAGFVATTQSDCLILIDSCTTGSEENLCNNIQLSNAVGMVSHWGQHNVDWSMMGVPVILIGIPTGLSTDSKHDIEPLTPCHIQDIVATGASVIAYALIRASYPTLRVADCLQALQIRQVTPLSW